MRALAAQALPILAALAGCAGPRQGLAGPDPRSASFRFAWPDGFRLGVTLRHESRMEGEAPSHALVHQVLVTEARGGELWVSTRESRGEGSDPDLAVNLAVGEAIVQVVSRDGAYLRAEGIDRALEVLESGGDEREPEEARRTLLRLTAEDWEISVGAWRGQRLELGKPRHKTVEGSLPLVPGIAVPLDVEYGLEGLVSCGEGEIQRACAELFYRTRPASVGKAELLRRLQGGLPEGSPAIVDVAAISETTLVTDPGTLVPRRLSVRQELRLRLRLPDGTEREMEERSVDEYRFETEVEI